jgi:hypothetical protein
MLIKLVKDFLSVTTIAFILLFFLLIMLVKLAKDFLSVATIAFILFLFLLIMLIKVLSNKSNIIKLD